MTERFEGGLLGFLAGMFFGGIAVLLIIVFASDKPPVNNEPVAGTYLDSSHTGFCGCTPEIVIEND